MSAPVPPPGLLRHRARDLFVLAAQFAGGPEAVGGYVVRRAADWAELGRRVRTAAPSAAVLVRAEADDGARQVRELIRATPSVPVVAAVPFREVDAAHVRALLADGVAEVVSAGGDVALAGMVPALRRAHARPLKRRMEARLPVWVPEDARTLLRAAAETVVDGGGREMFAEIFGVYVRTAATKCREYDLPPPRRLLGWVRVLLALMLLEEAERTVMNVALVCGYRDNSSLKRAIENFGGAPALASIRDRTFADAFRRFAAELRDLRHGLRSASPAHA